MTLYEKYYDKRPVGVQSFTNTFGVALFMPDEEDRSSCDYIAAFHDGTNYYRFRKAKVHYASDGRAFIHKGGIDIYLDEVMRI